MADNLTNGLNRSAELAAEAYFYGYPLVLSDITFITLAGAGPDGTIAYNRFNHLRQFPDASFTDVVSPNVDTLYSVAILDLEKQPVTLSVPEMGDRYYLLPILDSWTNVFASPGTRTSGNGAGTFIIAGPRWQGKSVDTAAGNTVFIRSPTTRAALLGRTQTNGKADYAAVRAIQDSYCLNPGSDYQPPPLPGDFDLKTPPKYQLEKMTAGAFFNKFAVLLASEFPAEADAPLLERFAAIGILPGKKFNLDALSPETREAVERGYEQAKEALENDRPSPLKQKTWLQTPDHLGNYGTDYRFRAATARFGWGANLSADSVYAKASVDDNGDPLTGAKNYFLHFAPGTLPPVKAFWSITLYNDRQFLSANPIDRYALGDRDDVVLNDDGGMDIVISHDLPKHSPAENWLPAPEGSFNLIIRLYWPDETILEGRWPLPAIRAQPIQKEAAPPNL